MEKFDYTVETTKTMDAAVTAVEARTKENGFGVLHIHDVKATLEGKGFPCAPLKIVEICNPRYASEVLKKDISIALMLPCPVSVYVQDGKTYISALRPRAIGDFYPAAGIQALAGEVDDAVLKIVNAAK